MALKNASNRHWSILKRPVNFIFNDAFRNWLNNRVPSKETRFFVWVITDASGLKFEVTEV